MRVETRKACVSSMDSLVIHFSGLESAALSCYTINQQGKRTTQHVSMPVKTARRLVAEMQAELTKE